MEILDKVDSPKDLKQFDVISLKILADEIRHLIISTVASNGGHLAASLGAVELAIGIHYVFDTPYDCVIWDVGHQSYAHKILTGRRDSFHTLRQENGISGFPNKDESPYDVFTTGHGSTSISCALGVASTIGEENKDKKVIAVIGDGSLTGGMAFEALNHAGHSGKNLIIILNDNEFSISASIGGLRHYLTRILTNPAYNKVHTQLESFIKSFPMVGDRMFLAAKKLEEGLKHLLTPGIVFEELGLRYFGPIDGNDVSVVISTLKNIKNLQGPVIIHAKTKKGKGYILAEKLPEKFHGINPFDIETGIEKNNSKDVENSPYTKIFSDTLLDIVRENKKVTALTAAMPMGTGVDSLEKEFQDRFFNVGMAEEHAVGFAAGQASGGKIPVVAIYSTFMQRSYDQILNEVCLQNLHVVFALDRAGIVGEDGPTHQGIFDIAYFMHMPNMTIMAPKDGDELRKMLRFAVNDFYGPICIRYPRGLAHNFIKKDICPLCNSNVDSNISYGKWETLIDGKNVAVLACGSMVSRAYKVCQKLNEEGINPLLINARFLKPIDFDMLDRIIMTEQINAIITIEEGVGKGGFGSEVVNYCAQKFADKKLKYKILALPDKFIEHGRCDSLLKKYGLSQESIYEQIKLFFDIVPAPSCDVMKKETK